MAVDLPPRRARRIALPLLVVCVVLATAAAIIPSASPSLSNVPIRTHTVTRGELLVTVTEAGTLESSKNVEIKCNVRGGYGGRGGESTVTYVIPSGSYVQEGDELVRLDTKIIEETVSLGKTDTHIAMAELARTEADLAKATIAVDAYLNGRYRSQLQGLQMRKDIASRNLRTSQTMLDKAELLFQQGYVTELDLEVNGYTLKQAELEVQVIDTQMDVLNRLTKAMELETLNGQLEATRARLKGRQAGLELEQSRLDLAVEELGNCVIKAPQSGLVIYPSTAKWKAAPDITAGASIRKDQVLLLMPDLSRMQVKIGIHESIVDRVKTGQLARVHLPDRTIETEVASVASVASPAGWWTGNVVRYGTTIRLPSKGDLKPGMSAQVDVVVARYENALSVPVTAVLETPLGHFCWVKTESGPERRSLRLGDNNDQSILVEEGLAEGDEVVLNPLASITEARRLLGPEQVHTIERGDLLVTLTEQGAVESANNTQIKCRVRGNSTINWVIESGTYVQAGDELVRLENKQIEDYLHERTKYAYLSRDAAIGYRANANRAGLAIPEYLEGRYRSTLMSLEKDLAIAESKRKSAQNLLNYALKMAQNQYVSNLEVEEHQFALREAQAEVEIKKTEIDVLTRFTKEEELATLKGNWESAKAAAKGHEEVLTMDEARMQLAEEEIKRCVIRAEQSGLVIYPKAKEWDDEPDVAEGATVHNDQVLLLMPDLSDMQVQFGVHESMVDHVKPGMMARVTLPDHILEGEVTYVASAAEPAGWWTGNIVKYDAVVRLPNAKGLKPGMTAEVAVILARYEDVLRVPAAAVVAEEERTFCWVGTADDAERRELQLGEGNETFLVVEEGLREGEQVVLNPAKSSDTRLDSE